MIIVKLILPNAHINTNTYVGITYDCMEVAYCNFSVFLLQHRNFSYLCLLFIFDVFVIKTQV